MPATLKQFESVWPQLVKDIEAHCEKYKLPEQALTWFNKVCDQFSCGPLLSAFHIAPNQHHPLELPVD
jgi:farnesyl diphosphate synthase